MLTLGAFLMQFMVQGAWGVIPAHLTELSPPEVRGLFSGLAYQIGVLLASGAAVSQALLAERFGYAATLAGVAAIVMVARGRRHLARPRAHGPRPPFLRGMNHASTQPDCSPCHVRGV